MLTFGYALFIVAASLAFTPQGYLQLPTETPMARICNNIGFVAGYLLIAVITFRRVLRVMPLWIPAVAGAVVIGCQILFVLQNAGNLAVAEWVPGALHGATGVSFALLFTFWASTAYLVDGKRFRFIVLAGSLISSFVVVFASAAESFFVTSLVKCAAMACSLGLLACFHYATGRPFAQTSSRATAQKADPAPSATLPLRRLQGLFVPVIATGILGFVYQYAWTFVGVNDLAALSFAIGEAFAVALIFLLASMPNGRSFSISRVFRMLCPVACVAMVPLFFTSGILQLLLMGIDSAVFNLFIILLMPLCASLGKRKSLSVPWLYALAASVVNLFPTLGFAVGSTPLARESVALYITVFVLMAVLFVAAFLADRETDDLDLTLGGPYEDAALSSSTDASPAPASRAQIASRMAEEYGLTKRECEILERVLLGRNAPTIAEELVISTNTVKTHVKRMYQKLGIHSRQELADLTEELEMP